MELTLTRHAGPQVTVACNGTDSHTFDIRTLMPDPEDDGAPPHPIEDAAGYGEVLYEALFPAGSPARQALDATTDRRLLLITTDDAVQGVPWEYARGPDGFLVLDYAVVRGLPAEQRRPAPSLDEGLHVVAVPSNPLAEEVEPLNIEGEWLRLTEVVQELPQAITLERTYPPTPARLRRLVANQQQRVVHFMGHGLPGEEQAHLLFEDERGGPKAVSARDLMRRLDGAAVLVTLNACVSATPGETVFSNLAAALVARGTPYALGMQFVVADDDARTFARTLYEELARGTPIEDAVRQMRIDLRDSSRDWAVGVPVLYTSLDEPAPGFAPVEGAPTVLPHRPPVEVSALPRAEGAFQGRTGELLAIGKELTGDDRPRILTIHGVGGQGKTALAREAAERFAHARPGGVWATSLETLPATDTFLTDLGRFLGAPVEELTEADELQREVLQRLGRRRILLVLDNGEQHDQRFFPDFILWLKGDDVQHIAFIEPHGLVHAGNLDADSKVAFYEDVKEYEATLNRNAGRDDVRLHSYIISQTPFAKLKERAGFASRDEFHNRHIYFSNDDIELLLHAILRQ